MPVTDIVKAMRVIRSEQQRRDKEFAKLYKNGWRLARLADHFHISKQRSQQIKARLEKNGRL